MRNQKIFSELNNSFPVLRSIIFLFALIFGILQTASAQQPGKVSVEVGKTKCNKLRKAVNGNVQKTVNRPAIVKASFNPTTEVFCVEGLTVGQTRVTFAGTYRQDGNNNNNNNNGMIGGLQQNGVRFKYDLDVTVVQRVENTNANVFNVQVERGKNKDIRIETLLGQEFANTADNGERWRNIVLTEGNKEVVRGDLFDNNQLKVRVTGVGNGKTKLILQGELLRNSVWETIARTLEVTVTAGSVEPTDLWLEAMKRRLAELKNTAAQAGASETKLNDSIRNFEGFITLVAAEIAKERRLPNPREMRETRLENLRDETDNELLRLRNRFNELAKQIRTINWFTDPRDLDISLGKLPAQRTFFCPPNPQKKIGTLGIYGTDRYLNISKLCTAALHAGAVTLAGGNITAEFHKGTKGDKYLGSNRNGVATWSWERDWGYFVFVR